MLEHRWLFPSTVSLAGVKLPEAAKKLGKKFACGASVTKVGMHNSAVLHYLDQTPEGMMYHCSSHGAPV